jgi:hypothetical protein
MTNDHSLCSNKNLMEMRTNYCSDKVHIILICSWSNLYLTQYLPEKLTFYGTVFKSVACVAIVRKAADEIRITIFFKSIGVKKIDELIVSGNKLTNNFEGPITRVRYDPRAASWTTLT